MAPGRALALVALLVVAPSPPGGGEVGSAPGDPGDALTAEAIYERVLANRFDSAIQELTLFSNRGERFQPVRLQLLWRRYTQETEESAQGIRSRTVVRYLAPPEIRRTGVLVVDRRDPPDDHLRRGGQVQVRYPRRR